MQNAIDRRSIALFASIAVVSCVGYSAALADRMIPDTQDGRQELIQKLDAGRVGLVTGGPGGTYIKLGSDLSDVVGKVMGDDLRVVVMEGQGSVGNLRDLAFLRFTDLALVQADVLEHIRRTEPLDYQYLRDRIAYVARFHPEIIHVLARGGPFREPRELRGKTIAVGGLGGGTRITAPIVFRDILGIETNFVAMSQREALRDLLSDDPSIDGLVYVSGRGSSLFKDISEASRDNINRNGVFFVPFPAPPPGNSQYVTEALTNRDYDAFIVPKTPVPVWAVPAVLAVYNWDNRPGATARDRNRRITRFVNAFFANKGKLDDGRDGYNDNWCSIDIALTVTGWTRIDAADDWLRRHPDTPTAVCKGAAMSPNRLSRNQCVPFLNAMNAAGISTSDPGIETVFTTWLRNNPGRC